MCCTAREKQRCGERSCMHVRGKHLYRYYNLTYSTYHLYHTHQSLPSVCNSNVSQGAMYKYLLCISYTYMYGYMYPSIMCFLALPHRTYHIMWSCPYMYTSTYIIHIQVLCLLVKKPLKSSHVSSHVPRRKEKNMQIRWRNRRNPFQTSTLKTFTTCWIILMPPAEYAYRLYIFPPRIHKSTNLFIPAHLHS